MKHYALAWAINDMAARYGLSLHRAGLAFSSDSGTFDRKPWEYWDAAGRRQYRALQRLTRALRDAQVAR